MSFYKLLDLKKSATKTEIRKKFRKLAKLYHPDRNPEDKNIFKNISYAYRILMDSEKRDIYNRYGLQGIQGFHGKSDDPNDCFKTFCNQKADGSPVAFIIILPMPLHKRKPRSGKRNLGHSRSRDARPDSRRRYASRNRH